MTDRLFERAVLDWLEDGSDRTPRRAIDAVLLAVKTTPQERALRIPRRFNLMPAYLRLAAIVAVTAVAGVGAYSLLNISPGTDMPSGAPATPAPTATALPAPSLPPLTAEFISRINGFAINYPDDWIVNPATLPIDPETWTRGVEGPHYDRIFPIDGNGQLRLGSVLVPEDVNPTEWVARLYLDCSGSCLEGLTEITIDGQPALLRGDLPEREMILILADRAYFATLFPGPTNGLKNVPELFDALMATLDLRPEDAAAVPTPSVR